MLRTRITKRKIAIVAGIWAVLIIISLVFTAVQLRWGNLRELNMEFGRWQTPGQGRRVVVFAPHCDDEMLGAGGLMRQAAAKGAKVTVVLMTNGDGSRYAATLDSKAIKIKPEYYIDFGYRRQQETKAALKTVGVTDVDVVTLGYPDKGLEKMWTAHWRSPYVSRYTHGSESPYANSMTKNAPFTGQQLLSDINMLLRKLDPTDIYIPHPNDQHPDHWATSAFVTEALYGLDWLGNRHVGLYLVHRGDWPLPQGLHKERSLAPPAGLGRQDTHWYQYWLDNETVSAKRNAMDDYKSQTGLNRRFLLGFVRQNELFGIRNPVLGLRNVSGIKVDGKTDDWEGIEPVIIDPRNDGLPSHSKPCADLMEIYAAKDSERLYLRIKVRGAINKSASYDVRIRPMGISAPTSVVVLRRGAKPPKGWQVAFGKREIEASCALGGLKDKPFMLAVGTKYRWFQIDRSAFRILE